MSGNEKEAVFIPAHGCQLMKLCSVLFITLPFMAGLIAIPIPGFSQTNRQRCFT
jgi:hypothetical protein